jgi:hypothetical protein
LLPTRPLSNTAQAPPSTHPTSQLPLANLHFYFPPLPDRLVGSRLFLCRFGLGLLVAVARLGLLGLDCGVGGFSSVFFFKRGWNGMKREFRLYDWFFVRDKQCSASGRCVLYRK